MRYDHLADQLKKFPERYKWFGPYWFTVKKKLNDEGFNFGTEDEPGTRQQILDYHGGKEEEAFRAALHHYRDHTGIFGGHDWKLPDGSDYFLHDAEMSAHSHL